MFYFIFGFLKTRNSIERQDVLLDGIHCFGTSRPSPNNGVLRDPLHLRGQSGTECKMGHQHDNCLRDVNRRAKNVTSHYWPISNYELAK